MKPPLTLLEARKNDFRHEDQGVHQSKYSHPVPITNSPELSMLDVCKKTNLHHRALVRSDQLLFSGHFCDLKTKGTLQS